MNKTLHTFGCSYTYGSGLLDLKNKWDNPSKMSFPALLSGRLGYQIHNYSCPGSSNQKIHRSLLSQFKNFKENDIVFVLWTFPDRLEYLCDKWTDLGYWEVTKQNNFFEEADFYRKTMLLNKNSHVNNVLKTVDLINSSSTLLQNNNIKYFFDFLYYKYNHLNEKDSDFFINYKQVGSLKNVNFLSINNHLEELKSENRFSSLDRCHPNEEAHKIYTEFLFKEINEKL